MEGTSESGLTTTPHTMSSPQVRQRPGQKEKKSPQPAPQNRDGDLNGITKDTKLPEAVTSEWDYKLALAVITLLAFITRFWGIGHPNEVVFDEVHFGKVDDKYPYSRPQAATDVWTFKGIGLT